MRALLLTIALLFLGACGQPRGRFPSLLPRPGENPRVMIATPAQEPAIDPIQRSRLQSELQRQETMFADVQKELEGARRALVRAQAGARSAPEGSGAWVELQMVLSRFDQARARLADIGVALADLGPLADGLPQADPDRMRLADLEQKLEQARAENERLARSVS
jgi:hypothetical protein